MSGWLYQSTGRSRGGHTQPSFYSIIVFMDHQVKSSGITLSIFIANFATTPYKAIP